MATIPCHVLLLRFFFLLLNWKKSCFFLLLGFCCFLRLASPRANGPTRSSRMKRSGNYKWHWRNFSLIHSSPQFRFITIFKEKKIRPILIFKFFFGRFTGVAHAKITNLKILKMILFLMSHRMKSGSESEREKENDRKIRTRPQHIAIGHRRALLPCAFLYHLDVFWV